MSPPPPPRFNVGNGAKHLGVAIRVRARFCPVNKMAYNYRSLDGCTPLNSEKFMRRAVYHKVYVLKSFCKTKI